jgi:2-polyprenyl-6-methoxyphenol hydroxylase-like FAD-dependent oxidoreductase
MAGRHSDLRRMVRDTGAGTVERFNFGAGERVRPWPSTSVTLLGDALHSMPPVGGLGGNAALRDAGSLCRALTEVHEGERALLPALGEAEAEMIEHGFAASREAQLYTKLAILRSRTVRASARGFFRLCGAVPPLRRGIFENGGNAASTG